MKWRRHDFVSKLSPISHRSAIWTQNSKECSAREDFTFHPPKVTHELARDRLRPSAQDQAIPVRLDHRPDRCEPIKEFLNGSHSTASPFGGTPSSVAIGSSSGSSQTLCIEAGTFGGSTASL